MPFVLLTHTFAAYFLELAPYNNLRALNCRMESSYFRMIGLRIGITLEDLNVQVIYWELILVMVDHYWIGIKSRL